MSGAWSQARLGTAATLQRGYDLPYRERKPGAVPIITSAGFGGTHSEARVRAPGVVTGRYGTIGEVFIVDEDFWPLNTTLYVRDFHGNDPFFIAYLLRTIDFQSHSGKSGVPGVNRNDLHELEVELPPVSEQRAIAAALSDVDALIGGLDQLITKKRDIKLAAMQQLLTGQTRLPGFSGDWDVKRLGDIGSFSKGRGLAKGDMCTSGDLAALPYTAIFTDHDEIIQVTRIRHFAAGTRGLEVVNSPQLLIAGSSNMLENIGKATAFLGGINLAVGGDIIMYRTTADVRFLSYLMGTTPHRRRVVFLSQGSTIRHVYASTFQTYKVLLPSLKEQASIAAVLADMDAEIAALEIRRDKTRALKQGMMQELLTGRIRLI